MNWCTWEHNQDVQTLHARMESHKPEKDKSLLFCSLSIDFCHRQLSFVFSSKEQRRESLRGRNSLTTRLSKVVPQKSWTTGIVANLSKGGLLMSSTVIVLRSFLSFLSKSLPGRMRKPLNVSPSLFYFPLNKQNVCKKVFYIQARPRRSWYTFTLLPLEGGASWVPTA